MEKLLKNSVLDELYQHRNEEVSHHFIKNSKEYKEHEKAMESRLMELLHYVPRKQYYHLKDDIEVPPITVQTGDDEFIHEEAYDFEGFEIYRT